LTLQYELEQLAKADVQMKRFPEPPDTVYAKRGNHRKGIFFIVLLASLIGTNASATPALCHVGLTIELAPDVPNPRDDGFLSSLLSNNVAYMLTLQRERNDVLVVELTGPGPSYRCQNVIEAIRKDGRVQSIQVNRSQLGAPARTFLN
jgi:hypothetical protein